MQNKQNNTLNGVELCIPNYFEHNTHGYIGRYEKTEPDKDMIKNNFYKIVHFFKYTPYNQSYHENDVKNSNVDLNRIRPIIVKDTTSTLSITGLPFMYLDSSNKVQYTHKDVIIPNENNPLAGKNPASFIYKNVHAGELPILTLSEANRIRDNDIRPVGASENNFDPCVTNCVATIQALRQRPEYGVSLKEYILVSLGELDYYTETGEKKTLAYNENVELVEVSARKNYISPSHEASDDIWDRMLEINRNDIERINKANGGMDATPEGMKAVQLVKSMSVEDKNNLDQFSAMSEEDKKAFEEFKNFKSKNTPSVQEEFEDTESVDSVDYVHSPTAVVDETYEKFKELKAQGKSFKEIRSTLGINPTTYSNYNKLYEK